QQSECDASGHREYGSVGRIVGLRLLAHGRLVAAHRPALRVEFRPPLFGVNLSGFTMGVTGYGLHWRVGDLWSGGGYGPEGSLLTTAIVVALFFVLHRVIPNPERGAA